MDSRDSVFIHNSPKPPGLRQANASNALRRRAGLNAGASCARCLRAAEVLLLPLLRCKPYLTSVPTDCGSSSPCEASLELPTCRPRRSRLSPSSSLQVRRAADCCCCVATTPLTSRPSLLFIRSSSTPSVSTTVA